MVGSLHFVSFNFVKNMSDELTTPTSNPTDAPVDVVIEEGTMSPDAPVSEKPEQAPGAEVAAEPTEEMPTQQ